MCYREALQAWRKEATTALTAGFLMEEFWWMTMEPVEVGGWRRLRGSFLIPSMKVKAVVLTQYGVRFADALVGRFADGPGDRFAKVFVGHSVEISPPEDK